MLRMYPRATLCVHTMIEVRPQREWSEENPEEERNLPDAGLCLLCAVVQIGAEYHTTAARCKVEHLWLTTYLHGCAPSVIQFDDGGVQHMAVTPTTNRASLLCGVLVVREACVHIALVEDVSSQPFQVFGSVMQVHILNLCLSGVDDPVEPRDKLESALAMRAGYHKSML